VDDFGGVIKAPRRV